jgi:hypothetical protein
VHFPPTWLLLLATPLLQASENNGIKITIRYGEPENSNQQTIYTSGDRKRMEFQNSVGEKKSDGSMQLIYGPRLVAITRCDLGQIFELNLDTSEYTSAPYPPQPLTKEQVAARGLKIPAAYGSEKPTLRIEVRTTDTGERKEMFGHIARHVLTTRKQIPLEGSQSQPQETTTDAWYIDLDRRLSCDRKWPLGRKTHAYLRGGNGKQPLEKPEFIVKGEPETGFALHSLSALKITHTLPDGTPKQADSKREVLVTQLEEGPLDPGLFEIPSGFRHVEHIERNPTPSASSSPMQIKDLWQRLKASVKSLF